MTQVISRMKKMIWTTIRFQPMTIPEICNKLGIPIPIDRKFKYEFKYSNNKKTIKGWFYRGAECEKIIQQLKKDLPRQKWKIEKKPREYIKISTIRKKLSEITGIKYKHLELIKEGLATIKGIMIHIPREKEHEIIENITNILAEHEIYSRIESECFMICKYHEKHKRTA